MKHPREFMDKPAEKKEHDHRRDPGPGGRQIEDVRQEQEQAKRDYGIINQMHRDSMFYLAETPAERAELNDRWLERLLIDSLIRSGSKIVEGEY